MIQIREVVSSRDYQDFLNFPFQLYKDNPYWVPPLKKGEQEMLDPKINPAYDFCDARFWTAWKDRKCVGRIGAIINHAYNEKINRQMGRFTRMEFIDDREVSSMLFATAEQWLRDQGMEAVHGPLGFSNIDNQGLLIEGFDYLPSQASVMHFPYYQEHIEALGYGKEEDWVEFRLTIGEVPEKAQRLADIIMKRNNLQVLRFKDKSQFKQYANQLFRLMSDSFDELPYVTRFTDRMIDFIIKKYTDILQPKYIVLILRDEQLVGFIVGMPSLSKALQKAKGKLFPTGLVHLQRALKKPEVVDLLLTGVDVHYQKLGLPAILINELQKSIIENGGKYVETTGMFESNLKGATHWKNYEHIQHKRRRCFVKSL